MVLLMKVCYLVGGDTTYEGDEEEEYVVNLLTKPLVDPLLASHTHLFHQVGVRNQQPVHVVVDQGASLNLVSSRLART